MASLMEQNDCGVSLSVGGRRRDAAPSPCDRCDAAESNDPVVATPSGMANSGLKKKGKPGGKKTRYTRAVSHSRLATPPAFDKKRIIHWGVGGGEWGGASSR